MNGFDGWVLAKGHSYKDDECLGEDMRTPYPPRGIVYCRMMRDEGKDRKSKRFFFSF